MGHLDGEKKIIVQRKKGVSLETVLSSKYVIDIYIYMYDYICTFAHVRLVNVHIWICCMLFDIV